MNKTLREALVDCLRDAGKFNKGVQAKPAAVLWTDAERQWEHALPQIKLDGLVVLTLGAYDSSKPEALSGPAIWVKCVVAGMLPEVPLADATPVIYLPGVSRADLRAIESCTRELQPLAELQYRGVFWSQASAKDWTVNAFLTSKNGGLELDVAQDKATQEALRRVMEAGVLLDQKLDDLKSRHINAAWLDSLLAPNPTRDILAWLNNPAEVKAQWAGGRWDIFVSRCKKDFGFDPVSEGELTAAEKLAGHAGAWAAVWELYRDSYTSFPGVAEQLGRLQPPAPKGLFDDLNDLAGYPRANEDAESALRYQLNAIGAMTPPQARESVLKAEKEHGVRRQWLWSKLGRAPLARAVQYLAEVAALSAQVPGGATPDQLADKYREGAWRVDGAALKAMAAVNAKADIEAVSAALRTTYVPWLEDTAIRLQEVTKAQGWLAAGPPNVTPSSNGVCTVFVDGLRYDTAVELKGMLEEIGPVLLEATWTSIPSVTASGKAWASPVAQAVAGRKSDEDFQPSVAADGKPLSTYNFRKLLEEHGIQVLDKHQIGDPTGSAWVECGDLDPYGHEHGLRLARDMHTQLSQIVERLQELKEAGWSRFSVVTDHGWLLVPGGLPKSELPKHQVQTRWGRCAVLKDSSHGTDLTFGWDWFKDVQIAMAPGISSFIAGAEYAHGGLSLQECLVPVIEVQVAQAQKGDLKVDITQVVWKGLRCNVEISPAMAGLSVDIRTKAALANSSVVAKAKAIEDGKASLAVADDAHMGAAAVVVILDAAGTVVQKASTTIGE